MSNGPKVSLTKHDNYLHENPADQMKENINTQIIHSNFEFASQTAPIILATTALRERRKVSLSLDSKSSSLIETDISASKQSLQSGGCSSKESTTSGRSSATPTQSLLSPPATSPTTPQVKLNE